MIDGKLTDMGSELPNIQVNMRSGKLEHISTPPCVVLAKKEVKWT